MIFLERRGDLAGSKMGENQSGKLPGELYLVDLGMVDKVRPAVVVSREDLESPRALAVCVPLTTENRGSAYEVALGKLKFLNKESWVNGQGLMSLGHEKLIRRLGQLPAGEALNQALVPFTSVPKTRPLRQDRFLDLI